MERSKKPLSAYEQSMLLCAMLFELKHISGILSFFPDEQRERMTEAKSKFSSLPRNDRLTQIVLELRRLILLRDEPQASIHQSWIDDALAQEPAYLRTRIVKALGQKKRDDEEGEASISDAFIVHAFISQLSRSPQKTAIFDPVLMRLQSLKNEEQEKIFSTIGAIGLRAFTQINMQHELTIDDQTHQRSKVFDQILFDKNPLIHTELRREIARYFNTLSSTEEPLMVLGIVITALYLAHYKDRWIRTIILGFKKPIGLLVEKVTLSAKASSFKFHDEKNLAEFLLRSLDSLV